MSDDWGYSVKEPIPVGGGIPLGAMKERAYLNRLRGPSGEFVRYMRLGSEMGDVNPIDVYEVSHDGLATPVHLYFDMYASPLDVPKVPSGFKLE